MEKVPEHNFHEVSEKRKGLRKAAIELGQEGPIYEEHYKEPLEEAKKEASNFKISEFGGLKGAKKELKKQKAIYEKDALADKADIDYEKILSTTPKIGEVQKRIENIVDLRDFRMRRMFEILNPSTSLAVKKRNEAVLKMVKDEIKADEGKLAEADPLILRQAELIEYKENLSQ